MRLIFQHICAGLAIGSVCFLSAPRYLMSSDEGLRVDAPRPPNKRFERVRVSFFGGKQIHGENFYAHPANSTSKFCRNFQYQNEEICARREFEG